MFAWLKNLVSEKITYEEMELGARYFEMVYGRPYFTPEHPGPDMSDFVKRYGTPTRVFEHTRHDN